jgi:hypothetical protein
LLPELPVLPVTEPTVRVRALDLAMAIKYAMTATATMITAKPVSTDESTMSGVLYVDTTPVAPLAVTGRGPTPPAATRYV